MTHLHLFLMTLAPIFFGIFTVHKKWYSYTFVCIIALSAVLKVYCSSDQFLHEWDERCHALVAKNLIQHPLKPTLYEHPVEPYDHKNWVGNHIWLMKPPIALWGMALSIKAFGVSEYSVRIPGVLYALGAVLLTFLIARRLFSVEVALIASFLHAIHGMLTDLSSGRLSSDGVESCFLFFVELGMYSVFIRNKGDFKLINYVLTGVITGVAFLSKWQPALLILVVMFVYHWDSKKVLVHIVRSSVAMLISLAVFAPWCVHILVNYPEEAKWILVSIFSPMITSGVPQPTSWYSLLTDFGNIYGYSTYLIIIVVIAELFRKSDSRFFALWIYAVLPLIIFSFAAVKRGPYIFIGAPAVFILIANMLIQNHESFRLRNKFKFILGMISSVLILGYSMEKLYLFRQVSRSREWSERIKKLHLEPGTVLYNEPHYLEIMFYHNDVTAYEYGCEQE